MITLVANIASTLTTLILFFGYLAVFIFPICSLAAGGLLIAYLTFQTKFTDFVYKKNFLNEEVKYENNNRALLE
jgi:hypothetical protein